MTTTETPSKVTKQNDFRPKSHPYFTQKVKLQSFHAQQVFERGFEIASGAIFSLSVVLRAVGSDEQAREIEALVDEQLTKFSTLLKNESDRLDKLAEANGIEFDGVDYSNPIEVSAKITSPRAVRYIGIIREFDQLVTKFDTLWLSSVITDSVQASTIYGWKRNILRQAGSIRALTIRAMSAAHKKNQAAAEASKDDADLELAKPVTSKGAKAKAVAAKEEAVTTDEVAVVND